MSKKQSKETVSKRQMVREQRAKKQRQQRLVTIGIIGVVALAVVALLAIPYIRSRLQANQPVGDIVKVTPVARPQADRNSMGDPNAPVKIVEYSDYQCPFCKRFSDETQPQIVDTYVATGKVYFTYRSMGNFVSDNLRTGGVESKEAAEAAYCAADQNKYWEYHDMLFANWKGEEVGSFTANRLMAFGEALGLNMDEFRSCYNGNKYANQVQQDSTDGLAAGIKATPSFLINGKLVEGALPFSDFQQQIEAALTAAN